MKLPQDFKYEFDPPLINIYAQWRYSRVTSSTINKSFQLHFTSLITMVCFINHSKHSFIAFIHLLTRLLMYSCCEWCLSVFLWTWSHISLVGDEYIQVIIIAKWRTHAVCRLLCRSWNLMLQATPCFFH